VIEIKKISADDLKGLKILYEDGFEDMVDFEKMGEVFNAIRDKPEYYLLCARSDGKVVGSAMGILCQELYGKCLPFMVIENLVVLSGYRRSGIARKLLNYLEELAVQHKCTMIILVASEHRSGAHRLYESMGYGEDKVRGFRKKLF
jgi:GNAT superfamily N-acetyltransferase